MRRILIISPHYPPSNLAAVHRARLFALHLPAFGWEPHVLMVHERYYEERLDPDLCRLLPEGQRIYKCRAFPLTRPRLIGDIGLRGFVFLYLAARSILREQRIDLLYIHIPSFYGALLGRLLHAFTRIPYGIDYIDPWVQVFPGSERTFSRHWWSTWLSGRLEPIAVRRAAWITGVAEGYFKGVQERNPRLLQTCLFGAMPYGGEEADHEAIRGMDRDAYLFSKGGGRFRLVYAGALLPKAHAPLDAIFRSIAASKGDFEDVEFHFIGTGLRPDDPDSHTVRPHAERHGLWGTMVFEHPRRIPYLDVLIHLAAADAVFILGSTEPHYTPSKTYQAVLSGKPILAVLHGESTAVGILREAGAGEVIDFPGEAGVEGLTDRFVPAFLTFRAAAGSFDPGRVNRQAFDAFSARAVTRQLADLLDRAVEGSNIKETSR